MSEDVPPFLSFNSLNGQLDGCPVVECIEDRAVSEFYGIRQESAVLELDGFI